MNIAYCISAYKDPQQLKKLILALDTDSSFFFVHIDKRVKNISEFEAIKKDCRHLKICKQRFFVQWGGWNQVKYQELFLKEALEFPIRIDRILILTGMDYPLWSNDRIHHYFEQNPEIIMMKGINLTRLQKPSPMSNLLRIKHIGRDWAIKLNLLWKVETKLFRIIATILPFRRKNFLVINNEQWDIWQASGYFSVNREQAEYILQTLKESAIIQYFKFCFVPEEMTIPTIIFNSKYKKNAQALPDTIYRGLTTLAALHIFEYGKAIKIYTENDFQTITQSGKMFARKLCTGYSEKLIELLNKYLNAPQ